MAVDKLVDSTQLDADLTAVANAIRTKGGTSAQLAFPAGFVSAVNAIPTGGGGGGLSDFELLTEINITESVNAITYTIPDNAIASGSVFIVFDNVTHNEDWVYTQFASSGAGFYPGKSSTDNRAYWLLFTSAQTIGGKSAPAQYYVPAQSKSTGAPVTRNSNTIRLYLYSSSSRFTGGTIQIYGRTVS